ncbi:MAG: hypothetical protein KKI02_07630 [Planctomycetes bacterium]|nr:hypothetical protein [Planctomycetota bacterium]
MMKNISHELRVHVPFTIFGTLLGVAIMVAIVYSKMPRSISKTAFEVMHPAHVLLSAAVTAGLYRLYTKGSLWKTFVVGYVGAIGVATLSDCIIPYVGELLLGLPHSHPHIGFIELWWLVNPLALLGIAIGWARPKTKYPHAGHVLLSTAASLFHVMMALGEELSVVTMGLIAVFLFLAVWVPCCTSDIVFPLLFTRGKVESVPHAHG